MEKAGRTRQVRAGKANVSEPLTTCRKRRDVIETRLQSLAWDEAREAPVYCPSGDRHEGGASPAQALVRNVGTCCPDVKGELRVEDPQGGRVPMRGAGADGLVVAMKPGNAGRAKGPNDLASGMGQPATGGVHA
jgi:hypothetical protein